MAEEIADNAWRRFGHDPRLPAHAGLRAADADRAVVSDVLAGAYAEGRLDRDELEERTDRLAATKTLGELSVLIDDLLPAVATSAADPAARRREAERRYLKRRQQVLGAFLIPSLICWLIWAGVLLTDGPGFPWPLFVMLGTGWPWVQQVNGRERAIADIEQQLAETEARRLRRLGRGGG